MTRNYKTGATILAVIAVLAIAQWALQTASSAQTRATVQAPMYQVDPFWPKPLPNNWVLGSVVGLSVDSRDHIWITHRGNVAPKEAGMVAGSNGTQQPGGSPPPQPGDKRPISSICCAVAPPILEFDMAGNLVSSWGGPGAGYQWPTSMHGVTVDGKDNVWLTTNQGHQMLKFTRQGKFLLQVGREGQSKGNTDTANLNRAAEAGVDMAANEVYVADGYGNRRVVVFDADTGAYKRHWGAFGAAPDDSQKPARTTSGPSPTQFNLVHDVAISNDGLVYVADRNNNRLQVFTLDGKFIREAFVARETSTTNGTVYSIAFSTDPQQRFLYVADAGNGRIRVLTRDTLEPAAAFGRWGRQAGQFMVPHSIATDSQGNLYVAEIREGRVQKFVRRR